MSALIANGTTELASSDVVIVKDDYNLQGCMFFLTDAAGGNLSPFIRADIQAKASSGFYFSIGRLTGQDPAKAVTVPGTYRVLRRASDTAFGVEMI